MVWLLSNIIERCKCLFMGISSVSSFYPAPPKTVKSRKNGVKKLIRIISPDSKKCSWFSDSRKLNILLRSAFPAQPDTGKPMSLSTPLPDGTCRASGGLQGGFPAEMPLSWKKGCSKCTLLEYPLVIINLFRLLFL